ncbi:MAG TPA: hypothetical protein VGL70_19615 [Candidatus Binatia bacterium]|jgi:hypothetical protein
MAEILKTLGGTTLTLLAGAMLLTGFFHYADAAIGTDKVWSAIESMLNRKGGEVIFTTIAAVVAYVVGIINIAAWSLLCGLLDKDLVLINQIESLQKPQLLKETQDFLNIKRALVGFSFPLVFYGFGLVCDRNDFQPARVTAITGVCLALLGGVLSPIIAWRMHRMLETMAKKLLAESPTERMPPTGNRPATHVS